MTEMLAAKIKNLLGANKKTKFAGLAINTVEVRLVVLEPGGDAFECVRHHTYELSSEEVLPALLVKIIEENQLDGAITSIVLPSAKVQSSQIEAETLPASDIQAALPWQLKDLISIPPQDMICDYIDMPLQPFGQTPKAQVVATSRQYLEKITTPFHDSKASISHILTEQFAVAGMQKTKDAAQLIFIQHPKGEAVLLILKNQQICFARKIRGTDTIVKMPIEQLKMGGTDAISIEIQRSIDYYESQLKQPPIKDVFVAIESEHLDFIIEALGQALPIRTKPFPLNDILGSGSLDMSYIPALGAALAGVSRKEQGAPTE